MPFTYARLSILSHKKLLPTPCSPPTATNATSSPLYFTINSINYWPIYNTCESPSIVTTSITLQSPMLLFSAPLLPPNVDYFFMYFDRLYCSYWPRVGLVLRVVSLFLKLLMALLALKLMGAMTKDSSKLSLYEGEYIIICGWAGYFRSGLSACILYINI